MRARTLGGLLLLGLMPAAARAQTPRINTLFPIGGKAGATVEVEVRGSGLEGANLLVADRPGLTGTVDPGGAKIDETGKPVWQAKCGTCHELRSPANRSMSPAQWAATVERMVKVRQAPLSAAEADQVTAYLSSAARAGKLTAKVQIAPDVQPGLYELRLVTPNGVSTACPFEVGRMDEVVAVKGTLDTAAPVTLPCAANGSLADNAERHYFKFAAKKGQRIVCNLKAFRYSEAVQMFFNPDLRLYDAKGNELLENHGYYELDPVLDWTCPADGDYVVEVRDLMGRGNPGNVYRMTMGAVPYDTVLYPPVARAGGSVQCAVVGKNADGMGAAAGMTAPAVPGITLMSSPAGPQPLYVTPYPVVQAAQQPGAPPKLPASFTGRIQKIGDTDSFAVTGDGLYEFEAFAGRIGSPLNARVRLLNADNNEVASLTGDNRFVTKLEPGKTYKLQVNDADGRGGDAFVYAVEARPAVPYLHAFLRPASITVRPGMAAIAEVIVDRRERVDGDVRIAVEGLPAGVTASAPVIQPDRGNAYVVLTAAAGAAQAEAPLRVAVAGNGAQGEGRAYAQPQELWRINNEPRYADRMECVLAVRGQTDFTGSVDTGGPVKLHPRKGVEIKVHIQRRDGFKNNVQIGVVGLPGGWVASPENAGADRNDVTLTLRPDGGNTDGFMKRDSKFTPITAYVVATLDEQQSFVLGSFEVGHVDKVEPEDR